MSDNDDILDALDELRIIVLIECEDGNFRQVLMTPERFKVMSDSLNVPIEIPDRENENLREGYELKHLHINQGWKMDADAFLGLSSTHREGDSCVEDTVF